MLLTIGNLAIKIDPFCVKQGSYTPEGLYNFYKKSWPNFVFPQPLLEGMVSVENYEIEDRFFYFFLEPRKIDLTNVSPQSFLAKVAAYQQKVGIADPTPVILPLLRPTVEERGVAVYQFFPKEEDAFCNDALERLRLKLRNNVLRFNMDYVTSLTSSESEISVFSSRRSESPEASEV
jgi:hypothetical protein